MTTLAISCIIKACIKQEAWAQRQLYKLHYSPLMKICLRYSNSDAEAIERYNDAFVKIFNQLHQLKAPDAFFKWSEKIVINTCIDYIRNQSNLTIEDLGRHSDIIENLEDISANGALPKLFFEDLKEHIQHLPNITKLVFNMYVFEGFSHKEIAHLLKIKEGTSYWHLNQARQILKRTLLKENYQNSSTIAHVKI